MLRLLGKRMCRCSLSTAPAQTPSQSHLRRGCCAPWVSALVIVNRGLKHDDGCLILPLSTNEFFVAYNLGKIDMKKKISEAVATGEFVRAMNKYVVEHRIDYVYSVGDSLMAFVARYWGISEAPYFPSLMSPDLPIN